MGIDEDVWGHLKGLKDLEDIEMDREALDIKFRKLRGKLHGEYESLKKAMGEGLRLTEPAGDYAIFYYGSEVVEKVKEVRHFFTNMESFGGQLILEDISGYTRKIRLNPEKRHPRSLKLGRLESDCLPLLIDNNRKVSAKVSQLFCATTNEAWEEREPNQYSQIHLNPYIESFVERLIFHDLGKEERVEEFRVEIRNPINSVNEQYIIGGGSIKHDSDPPHTLIVGDTAVQSYLKKEDVKVSSVSENPLSMPIL